MVKTLRYPLATILTAVFFHAGFSLGEDPLPQPPPAAVTATSEDSARELLSAAGEDFRIRVTDHFLIAYDTDYASVRPLVGRLDATFGSIKRFCRWHEVSTNPLPTRLGVLLFDRFEDFVLYSERVGVPQSGVAGFYHQGTNIAAFCNMLSSPQLKLLTEQIERLQDALTRLEQSAKDDAALRETADRLRDAISATRFDRDAFALKFNRTVIQHEAAHQMLYNIGVHVRGADNPGWLIEGLACEFELPQTSRSGAVDSLNQLRLADFRDALRIPADARNVPEDKLTEARKQNRLLPLADLLGGDDPFKDRDANVVFRYAQAWALVHYLQRELHEPFGAYLRRLQTRRPGVPVDADAELAEFGEFFGAPDADFERRWLAFMLRLRFEPREAGR